MQYDYYAFRKEQLNEYLGELEQASAELDEARKIKDKQEKKRAVEKAETKIKEAAKKTLKIDEKEVQVEPHLPYLWYEALKSDLKNSVRDAWREHLTANPIPSDFCFLPKTSDLDRLPSLSFMLHVPFKLRKPYLSKDDRAFHLLDNPIRKDKVFQTPMVASTSWKGALHSAMVQQLAEWWCNLDERDSRSYRKEFVARRIGIGRLFGTEKGVQIDSEELESYLDRLGDKHLEHWYRRYIRRYLSSSGFFSGRLYFYPTFFDKIGLEVINPHDRKKGTGKNPILLESVPIEATGTLVILYVPFGKVEKIQVAEDLKLTAKGVEALLTVYGFGAKTSSGFGVAELNGKIEFGIRADWSCLDETSTSKPKLEFLNDDGTLKQEFLNPDGSFRTEKQYKTFLQSQGRTHNKKLYQEAEKWWKSRNARPKLPEAFRRRDFISFKSLMTTAEACHKQQIEGGESNA